MVVLPPSLTLFVVGSALPTAITIVVGGVCCPLYHCHHHLCRVVPAAITIGGGWCHLLLSLLVVPPLPSHPSALLIFPAQDP